jgi:putative component of toxin-antitoxin plasmid stabilization module
LRDGIHELRARVGKVNYRILYGFVGTEVALLACGLTKQQRVPPVDIDRAVARVNEFQRDPKRFGYSEAE